MSFLKKIFNKLTNNTDEDNEQDLVKLGDQLKNADLDYKFAQLFTHSGGFFNYCSDEAEALQTLYQILKIENIDSVFCWDEDLINFLNVINVPYTKDLRTTNTAAFITCEYLIAYDGKIVLSYNNIQHYDATRLPEKIILMANVSQIVNNLTDAMTKIKRTGSPKNLTSISGKQSQLGMSTPDNTKLFLLLIED